MRRIAKRYAKALFDAVKKESLVEVKEIITALSGILENTSDLRSALSNPAYPMNQRVEVLKALAEKLAGSHREIVGLAVALLENGRIAYIKDVVSIFGEMTDAYQRLLSLEISSAYELSDEEKSEVTSSMRSQLGGDVSIAWSTDEDLIGGLRIKAGDVVLDNTIKENLRKISESLSA